MSRRPAALMAFALVAALLLGTAGPAAADGPTVTITSPGDEPVTDANAVIAGTASTDPFHTVQSVRVTVTRSNGETRGCDAPVMPDGSFACSPGLPFNGPYKAVATATDALLVDLGERRTGPAAEKPFSVAVPPAPPQDVKVEVGPDRRVTISWVRNSEPDVSNYRVTRLAPGGGAPSLVSVVRQPSSGERVSAVDEQVPPAGGSYRYLVTAIRPGATSQSETSLDVPAAPADGAPAAGAVGPGTAAGTARRPGAGARGAGGVPSLLSGLGGEQTLPAGPEGEVLPVDDGFALPGAEGEGYESADPAVLDDSSSVANERALFVPLAAGLLLCVIAFHLRQFNRTVLSAPPAYHPLLEPEPDDRGRRADHPDEEDGGAGGPRTAVLVGARRAGDG